MKTPGLSRSVLLALSLLPGPALAADGDLDPTFGKGGKVFTSFGYPAQGGTAMALDSDERIVVAGFTFDNTANIDFAVARYLPGGLLDPTFGSGGFVATDFFGGGDLARGVAIQSDGRIVVGGATSQGSALVRYNVDGTLDESFDGDGKVTTSAGIIHAVAIQPDGRIVAAGTTLTRYNSDGSLDQGFGVGGVVPMSVFSEGTGALAVALQPDGKVVVAGAISQTGRPTADDWLLARFEPDGDPDSTFGSKGVLTTDFFGRGDAARTLLIRPDGRIVAAGTAGHPSAPGAVFAVARYLENGTLDPTFDGDGRQTSDLDGFDEVAFSVAAQSDGKIVLGGYAANPDFTLDFALVRYNANGSEDPTFGNLGRVRTDFFGGGDGASAIAVQADDKIVAAGSASGGHFFALVRYLGSRGVAVPSSCPHSAGFWKTHRSEWPVVSLTLGSESYSGDELAALLTKPVRGDASVVLARELIAAKFNTASGAGSGDLAAEVERADGYLTGLAGRLPYGVSPSSPLGHSMVVSAGRLAALNNRRSSPGCVSPNK